MVNNSRTHFQWHHRGDALSSLVCLIGIVGARLGYTYFDPIAACVVAGMVIKIGFESGSDAVKV